MPELGTDDEGRTILRVIAISGEIGRSMSTTPGVQKERLAALRKALAAMLTDARFTAAIFERRTAIESAGGEAMDGLAGQTHATPRALFDRNQTLVGKQSLNWQPTRRGSGYLSERRCCSHGGSVFRAGASAVGFWRARSP